MNIIIKTIKDISNVVYKPIMYFILSVGLLSITHWGLINIFITFCCNLGIKGIFQNIITLGSPICQLINHIQYLLTTTYIKLIASTAIAVSTWVIKTVLNK